MKRIIIFALLLIALTGCADEVRILSPEAHSVTGDVNTCVSLICTNNQSEEHTDNSTDYGTENRTNVNSDDTSDSYQTDAMWAAIVIAILAILAVFGAALGLI